MVNNYYYNFSKYWKSNPERVRFNFNKDLFKKIDVIFFIGVMFACIYFLSYILFTLFCIRLIKKSKYLFLFTTLIFILYILVPGGFVWGALRFRLPIEGFIIIFSFYEIQQLLIKKGWLKKVTIQQ